MEKQETQKMSLLTKIIYGSGNASANLLVSTAGAFLTFFYTDIAGLSPYIAGAILLVCRILDGITDLCMGVVVNRTHSKYGKARPWLLWMAIPYFISLVLMFYSPNCGATGKVIFAAATYILGVAIVYTIISVPYNTLSALITNDKDERTALSTWRQFFGIAAPLFINILTIPIINRLGGGQKAWTILAVIYGIIGAVLYLAVFLTTKEVNTQTEEEVKTEGQEKKVKEILKEVKALFQNKYWVIVLIIALLAFIMTGVQSGATVYYAKYIFHNDALVGTFAIAGMLPVIVGCAVIPGITKKVGKRNFAIAGLIFALAGCALTVIGSENLSLMLVGTAVRALGIAPLNIGLFAMLGDTVAYGEWKTGIRNEGLIFSAETFAEKVGQALGGAVTTFALGLGGYVAGAAVQTDGAILGMKFTLIYIPVIVILLEIAVLFLYKLDNQYDDIIKEIEARKHNA